jgi:cell division protein ZapA
VGVEPDERESLMAAAHLLDARMREIRGSNRMAALDRVAVLTALNLAHELLQLKQAAEQRDQALNRTLGELNRKLDGLFDAPR